MLGFIFLTISISNQYHWDLSAWLLYIPSSIMPLKSWAWVLVREGGGGGLPYKSDWDACQNIQIKPLRETNVGVAEAWVDP